MSVVGSALIGTAFGGVLLAFGMFRASVFVPVIMTMGLIGTLDLALRLWRGGNLAFGWWIGGAIIAAPWGLSAVRGDFRPAQTFQWFYADLGRALTIAGGVPKWVLEYGEQVRWLPDYVTFNILSEFYLNIRGGIEAQALADWRLPVALLGLFALFSVTRLWLSPIGASIATLSGATTLWFVSKFNAYKPEALGIVIGLASVWFVVSGVRERRPLWVSIGGIALGIALGIHAIAALVTGLMALAAGLVEWSVSNSKRQSLGYLVMGAGVSVLIALGVGWTLQGRFLVAADAGNPVVLNGTDPTWAFLQLSNGRDVGSVPSIGSQLATGVTNPWRSVDLLGSESLWFWSTLVLGLILAFRFAGNRIRHFLSVTVLFATLVGGAMAFFGFAFETYVPRHTGLSRLGQYSPLVLAMLVGVVVEGFGKASLHGAIKSERFVKASAAMVLLVCSAWAFTTVNGEFVNGTGIDSKGEDALDIVRLNAEPGDVVVSNAATRGSIEFFTAAENPLEGRQPLIEDPDFLSAAIAKVRQSRALFANPRDAISSLSPSDRPNWIIGVEQPGLLGANSEYAHLSLNNLRSLESSEVVWDSGDVVVVRLENAPTDRGSSIGPPQTTRKRATIVAALVLIALGVWGLNERRTGKHSVKRELAIVQASSNRESGPAGSTFETEVFPSDSRA